MIFSNKSIPALLHDTRESFIAQHLICVVTPTYIVLLCIDEVWCWPSAQSEHCWASAAGLLEAIPPVRLSENTSHFMVTGFSFLGFYYLPYVWAGTETRWPSGSERTGQHAPGCWRCHCALSWYLGPLRRRKSVISSTMHVHFWSSTKKKSKTDVSLGGGPNVLETGLWPEHSTFKRRSTATVIRRPHYNTAHWQYTLIKMRKETRKERIK